MVTKMQYNMGLRCSGVCSFCADTPGCYQYHIEKNKYREEDKMEFKVEQPTVGEQPKLYMVTYYEKESSKSDNWVFRHETFTNPGSFIAKVAHLSEHRGVRFKDINPGVVEHKPLSIESVLNPFG